MVLPWSTNILSSSPVYTDDTLDDLKLRLLETASREEFVETPPKQTNTAVFSVRSPALHYKYRFLLIAQPEPDDSNNGWLPCCAGADESKQFIDAPSAKCASGFFGGGFATAKSKDVFNAR